MLPLLPALIMLIVRGPSAMEAASLNAHKLNTREAVSRSILSAHPGMDAHALESLLELGKNPAFTRAIAQMIGLLPVEPESSAEPPRVEEAKIDAPPECRAPALRDGFAECRRTRDGPATA